MLANPTKQRRRPTTPATFEEYMERFLNELHEDVAARSSASFPEFPIASFGVRTPAEWSLPALSDVEETDEAYVVRSNLPGVRKEEIEVRLRGHRLEIDARAGVEKEERRKNFLRRERTYQGFARSIDLPGDVVPEKVAARYEDGVLTVTVPKADPRPERRIAIE